MTTAATEILAAGLVLVHHPIPAPAQDPLRVPRTTDTTALVETNVISATNRLENPPPANATIITLTLLARALPKAVRMAEVVVPVWGNAKRPRRNTTLGWRGRRTNGSQPRSE